MIVSFFALLPLLPLASSIEIVATNDWQRVGVNDTVPAGLEIRMDLSKHETWVRLIQEEEEKEEEEEPVPSKKKRCGPSCKDRQRARANLRGRRKISSESLQHVKQSEPLGEMAVLFFAFFFLWFVIFQMRRRRIVSSSQRKHYGGVHEL